MKQYEKLESDSKYDKQNTINIMYRQFTDSIKMAYDSCSTTMTVNEYNKKNWFTYELRCLKSQMLVIRHKTYVTQEDKDELKSLKKTFKKIMKKNIFLFEKNQLFKIENLIKCNNSESFFRKVNFELNKDKDKITINMDELVNHYHNIFNRPLNVSEEIKNRVNDEI